MLLHFMGARILGYGRRDTIDMTKNKHISQYFSGHNLPQLLQNCDYIVSILPNTNDTRGLLNGNILENCKEKGTVFVNIGRGTVISEESLVSALQKKWISGAILDVFDVEPLRKESPLWKMENVFISPHVSGSSRAKDIAEQFKENLKYYQQNLPIPATEEMAAIRSMSRLLSRKSLNTAIKRGYADEMSFTFAAGNQVFYDKKAVKQVDVPSFSGSFGILPAHVPTLAVLKPGVVTVFENDGKVNQIFVSSGTVTINDDSSVQILAEEAHPVENLDASAARDILTKAQSQLSSASTDQAKAEAEIAVEVGEALVKAVHLKVVICTLKKLKTFLATRIRFPWALLFSFYKAPACASQVT
ncbi:hypothetical protein NQ315_005525 [Exocentrus adspersus]|uniref:ATP synthase F(1) complex subunit delta, mitochondrial n=1 Tax=Exocentrus adspersus TaxID=1586481 RepID=A0AAV8VSY8_9CUCU|nr:hypothetical protein NQ315_005525 [Exocentrus adspersus]